MRRDEVRTIFSVYRIWQQEAAATADRRKVARAIQVVESRLTPPAPKEPSPEVAGFCRPKLRDLLAK